MFSDQIKQGWPADPGISVAFAMLPPWFLIAEVIIFRSVLSLPLSKSFPASPAFSHSIATV